MQGYFCRRLPPALDLLFLNAVCSYIAVGPDLKEFPKFRNVLLKTLKRDQIVSMHQGLRLEQSLNSFCTLLAAVPESMCFSWSPESRAFKIMQAWHSQAKKMNDNVDWNEEIMAQLSAK